MNLNTRRQIIREVRKNNIEAIHTYCQIIYKILKSIIELESKSLFYRYQHKFQSVTPIDFECLLFNEICSNAIKNEVCHIYFEQSQYFDQFENLISNICHDTKFKLIDKWMRKSSKEFQLEINRFRYLEYSSNSREEYQELTENRDIYEIIRQEISKFEFSNKKNVLELWIEKVKVHSISRILNINQGTVSAYIAEFEKHLKIVFRERGF
jgi:predicted translin family RNA/ssDNA-binding protein